MFKLEINTGNAAFEEPYKEIEVCRILEEIKRRIEDGHTYGKLIDINGNNVGKWSLDQR